VTAVSAPPDAPALAAELPHPADVSILRRWMSIPLVAWLVLGAALLAMTLLNDPGGYLGTDTGGKVLTFEQMARTGTLDPDLGYWAEEWDPDGALHPIALTMHFGERWVNVTTLPALLVAEPLYEVGGYRATLLIPIAGTVLCAAAARAIARRAGARTGWSTYWLVGLASPMAIYALDFWEHSVGVGLTAWAIVLLVDVGVGARSWRAAGVAGLLVGAAATMRTDVLAYGGVGTLVAMAALVTRRFRIEPVRSWFASALAVGASSAMGLVAAMGANQVLEHVVMGASLRAGRAATAATMGGNLGLRIEESFITTVGLNALPGRLDYFGGALIVGSVAYLCIAGRPDADPRRWRLAVASVLVGYVGIVAGPLGFVPGFLSATPLAVAGLAVGPRLGERARLVLAIGVCSLPVVFATQYVGGAVPQWGGRYVLTSAVLLAGLGGAALARLHATVRWTVVAASIAITVFGLSWLSVRSHEVADSFDELGQRDEPVLVSTLYHLVREGGAATIDQRWLTVYRDEDRVRAAEVVAAAGYDSFALVVVHDGDGDPPVPLAGFVPVHTDEIPFIEPVHLDVITYELVGD
jgi:hypothetical protein